jgi:excisionase family DNA binding protein
MELKSKREAAEMLGVSTRGIERAVRRGQLTVEYRDSKHGKKAWFNSTDLERYRRHQAERVPMGFTTISPPQPTPTVPTPTVPMIGAVVPMVDMETWPRKDKRKASQNPVPIADRLTLTMGEAAHLSGLPRSFIAKNIHDGTLKGIRIGRSYHVKRSDLDQFVQVL